MQHFWQRWTVLRPDLTAERHHSGRCALSGACFAGLCLTDPASDPRGGDPRPVSATKVSDTRRLREALPKILLKIYL